jgi:hypothetical protein
LEKNVDENDLKFKWEIIKIGKKRYSLIKNKYNNKFIEVINGNIKFTRDKNLSI